MSFSNFNVHPLTSSDRLWLVEFLTERWGAPLVVVHGNTYNPAQLAGFMAVNSGHHLGLVTYQIDGDQCEIITLDSLRPGIGVGSALIESVKAAAKEAGCRRIWLVTTNDNLAALRFYQRRGFELVAIHRHAVNEARKLKPQIPQIGLDGIPIRDEIELEFTL